MIYKAVSHIHSTISYDGKVSLSEIATLSKESGVEVVCITEHSDYLDLDDVHNLISECREYSDDSLLLVPGLEVPHADGHVLVIGIDDEIKSLNPLSVIEQYKDTAFIVFPHPHRSSFIISDVLLGRLDAIEVWNSQYDGKRYPRSRSLRYVRRVQQRGSGVGVFAGLDFHRRSHWGGPRIEIEAAGATQKEITRALKRGDYRIVGAGVEISSEGEVGGRALWKIEIVGSLYVFITSLFKQLSQVLHAVGIRPPQGIKEWLRRNI
ncbi:MAG: PHP domain-containing protein [Candidatus Paceibacterota bacterium]